MGAYFVRRLVGGVVTLFLAGLVIHAIAIYAPGGARTWIEHFRFAEWRYPEVAEQVAKDVENLFNLNKPWPVSYLAWLFDPSGPKIVTFWQELKGIPPRTGINIEIGSLQLQGSGVLTGDFGISIELEWGYPVLDQFGRGVGEIILLMLLAMSVTMGVVLIQRRGRPVWYELPRIRPGQRRKRQIIYRANAVNELYRLQIGGG